MMEEDSGHRALICQRALRFSDKASKICCSALKLSLWPPLPMGFFLFLQENSEVRGQVI